MREIILFNRCLNTADVDFKRLNSIAITKGYLVHPDCCNTRVLEWLHTQLTNYNNTFYKSWVDVTRLSRTELALDQLVHYASTYGTDFTGTPYVPNSDPTQINFTDCKLILPITPKEIEEKIQSMFYSGIALNDVTIAHCIALIEELNLTFDVEKIKNKEVMMYICRKTNTLPSSPEEMVRYLVYLYTDKTLLIKSKEVIRQIKNKTIYITSVIEKFGMEKLSSVFYRFKPLFLAMKRSNEVIINKLRRLATKNHKPKQFGYWSKILSDIELVPKMQEQFVNLNNYKLIALLQTTLVRMKRTGILPVTIRNGKLYVKDKDFNSKYYYKMIYGMLYKELINRLSTKACKVKLHPTINLALPTSEKSFIGNVPFGSTINLNKDSIVGINWKVYDGGHDLDLSIINLQGEKIGWNSDYYSHKNGVIYSGDMTYANPEATELLYCKEAMPDSIIMVNLYSGNDDSKFTLFFAAIENYEVKHNSMVDPNDVIFSTQLSISGEQICGMFINGNFVFMNLNSGKKKVSYSNPHTKKLIEHMSSTTDCYLNLQSVLRDAGFTIVDENPDLDLSTLDKSNLIKLLS
jgi:hypothetical protein